MALTHNIVSQLKLVYVRCEGIITLNGLMNHIEELAKDPRYIKPMKKLVDFRSVEDVSLSQHEIVDFVDKKAELNKQFGGEQCAIVAPDDSVYEMARIHDALIGIKEPSIETCVFRNIEEALRWLKIRPDDTLLKELCIHA